MLPSLIGAQIGRFIRSLGRISWVWVILIALGAYYTFQAGNQYGTYARAYRAVVAELAKKNKELEAARTDDERELPRLEVLRDVATARASGNKTCPVDKDLAGKLNAIGE